MTLSQEIKLKVILTDAHRDYESMLKKRAYFKVNDHMLSEDLVQNTFIKTWSYLLKGGKIDRMKAFLYHILNNLIIDEYRKHKPASLDSLLLKGFEPSVDDSSRMINKLDGREVLILIGRLPVKYQKVMRMRYVQDLSLEEMSQITGQSKNTIAVQIHRGLEILKSLCIPQEARREE
jgi:RNA polymerase sigma-70 factor (ECF subfamily)